MAEDPSIQRDLWSINAEFIAAESDGLGRLAEIGRETFAA